MAGFLSRERKQPVDKTNAEERRDVGTSHCGTEVLLSARRAGRHDALRGKGTGRRYADAEADETYRKAYAERMAESRAEEKPRQEPPGEVTESGPGSAKRDAAPSEVPDDTRGSRAGRNPPPRPEADAPETGAEPTDAPRRDEEQGGERGDDGSGTTVPRKPPRPARSMEKHLNAMMNRIAGTEEDTAKIRQALLTACSVASSWETFADALRSELVA